MLGLKTVGLCVLAIAALSAPGPVEGKKHRSHKTSKSSKLRLTNQPGAGVVHNTATQSSIQSQGQKLTGQYYMQNVATGGYLWWSIHPQTIIPSTTSKSALTLTTFNTGTQIHPTDSNGKCLAAQFSSSLGVDYAATMYACTNLGTVSKDIGDPQAKQQWHFVPASGGGNVYYVIPEDHLDDMATRALSSGILNTAGGYKSTSVELYNPGDTNQQWVLTQA